MLEQRIVADSLDKIADVFEMFRDGRVSATVVGVNLRKHAADLRAFDEAVADGLNKFATAVEAIDASGRKPFGGVREVEDRFDAWRTKVKARLEAEAEEARRKEQEAIEAAKRGETPGMPGAKSDQPSEEQDDEALRAAMAEIDALLEEDADAEGAPGQGSAGSAQDSAGSAQGSAGSAQGSAGSAGAEVDDEAANMTVEDIDKILEDTRKDL